MERKCENCKHLDLCKKCAEKIKENMGFDFINFDGKFAEEVDKTHCFEPKK